MAMKKDNGEVIANAHLIGMFKRICKLLFFNIKPIFVFDGPAPSLKRATLSKRRKRREEEENDISKKAEKLVLAQIKKLSKNNNVKNKKAKKLKLIIFIFLFLKLCITN